ncbi:MAG: ATP-binding protein [Candidatus Omnitrophota bacterium]
MKCIGGCSYFDIVFACLFFAEAFLNQPYNFIIRRVDLRRFQYYQMITDIIVASWLLHYMGGLEAPLVSIAYYAVIIWAGFISTTAAVFFAVIASAVCFSAIVIGEHFGILPFTSYYNYKMPTAQMLSLLLGNLAFLFAFGYFSAYASRVIRALQTDKQEQALSKITEHLKKTTFSRDYLNNIIKAMLDPLIVVDSQKRIVTVNTATCILLSYEEKELVGKKISAVLSDIETSPLRGGKLEKLIGTGTIMNVETYYLSKDKRKIPVLFSSSVMKDKTGEILWVVCTAKDITELKKAESELQEAYSKLKDTQAQLIQVEKMEAIGRMASGVAHEVKNPLAVIMQATDFLEERFPQNESENFEILQMIKNNIKRADNIVRGLVEFSRPEQLTIEPCDLSEIIEESLMLIRHSIKSENIEIVKELTAGLPQALVDKSKIVQVFVNVFRNAIQAMVDGGKLYVRTYKHKLSIFGNKVGRRSADYFQFGAEGIVVEIEDTGTGIPQENIKKIFDPFFSTKGPKEGTGLGLSVTKNIIDMHKGLIDVKSKVGKGTKVIITLKSEKETA